MFTSPTRNEKKRKKKFAKAKRDRIIAERMDEARGWDGERERERERGGSPNLDKPVACRRSEAG